MVAANSRIVLIDPSIQFTQRVDMKSEVSLSSAARTR